MEALADALSQNVKRWVCLHNFVHSLLEQLLSAIEPVAIATMEIVSQVECDKTARWTWVDRHTVSGVV